MSLPAAAPLVTVSQQGTYAWCLQGTDDPHYLVPVRLGSALLLLLLRDRWAMLTSRAAGLLSQLLTIHRPCPRCWISC